MSPGHRQRPDRPDTNSGKVINVNEFFKKITKISKCAPGIFAANFWKISMQKLDFRHLPTCKFGQKSFWGILHYYFLVNSRSGKQANRADFFELMAYFLSHSSTDSKTVGDDNARSFSWLLQGGSKSKSFQRAFFQRPPNYSCPPWKFGDWCRVVKSSRRWFLVGVTQPPKPIFSNCDQF